MSTKTSRPKATKSAAAKPARQASAPRGPAVADNLAMTREMFDYFKTHRDEGRQVLAQAGIYTKAGKLTKAYGG
jgi:hypothetical protein